MKKLSEDERLERGVQILLSSRDKEDLEKMARALGDSLSAATRPHVLRALERWRKQNPELVAQPLPQKPGTLTFAGKSVRTQRSLEVQMKATQNAANGNGTSNGQNGNGRTAATAPRVSARGKKK